MLGGCMKRKRISSSSDDTAGIHYIYRQSTTRRGRKVGIAAAALALFFCTLITALPVKALAISQLQQDANAVHNIGAVSVLAGVRANGNNANVSAGEFTRGVPLAPSPDSRFRAGSLTKTYVATIVLQLVGENKVSLDDKVDRWLPGVIQGNGYDGTKITIRDLLGNTSGLFDYTQDNAFVQPRIDPSAFHVTQFKHYSPNDLINIALSHSPKFAPGSAYAYSNTDYIVLGEVIKAVTGKTWDVQVMNRIVTPLALAGTSAPGDDPTLQYPFVFGYNIFTSDPASRTYTDTTFNNMTWAGAAGALITTTSDENKFMSSLLSGKLLKPAQLAQMKADIPQQPGAGLGIGHQTLSCGVEIFGHTGKVIGYGSYALATGDGSLSVTEGVATTTFTELQYYLDEGNASSTLLQDVFCPPAHANAASTTTIPQKVTPAQKPVQLTLPGITSEIHRIL